LKWLIKANPGSKDFAQTGDLSLVMTPYDWGSINGY